MRRRMWDSIIFIEDGLILIIIACFFIFLIEGPSFDWIRDPLYEAPSAETPSTTKTDHAGANAAGLDAAHSSTIWATKDTKPGAPTALPPLDAGNTENSASQTPEATPSPTPGADQGSTGASEVAGEVAAPSATPAPTSTATPTRVP